MPAKKIIGYERSELTGHHYSEFLHPEDSSITNQAILAIFESNQKNYFENRYIHKECHAVSIRWDGVWSDSDNVLYCVGRDMTAKKMSQSRLEETEQRYKALFDNSPDIIFAESKAGLITEVNQRFRETLNISEEQVLRSPASSFLSPEMAAVNAKYLEQALLGNYMRFDLEFEQDGKVRIFYTLKHSIIINNEITGVQKYCKGHHVRGTLL